MIATTRYEVLGHIASGGMGEILLARRRGPAGFEKLVVLKRPHVRLPSGPQALALLEEARLLARINHPNVCQVLDLEQAGDELYLVLELLEGLSLWAILVTLAEAGEALAPRALCGLVEQACEGLQAIHELGVIHRDISPGNLFVTEAGTLKLLDLGIAKARDTCDRTAPGSIKGKLPYLSPEQISGRGLDGRSDLFSLGLVMYDLARGRKPAHDRIGAYAREHLDLAAIEPALAAVIARAVAEAPGDRFASAAEMAQAVRAAGAAVGGAYTRSELVEWLGGGFSGALAERRSATAKTIACSAATPVGTRTLTMRSLLPTGDVLGTNGTERLSFDELQPPPPRPRRFVMALPVLGVVVGVVSAIATAENPAAAPLPPGPPPALVQPLVVPPSPPPPPPEPAAAPPPTVHEVTPRPKPPVASGTLTIDSAPAAWIDVAGYRDETPVYRHSLPAGLYTVQATLPDGRKQVKRVRVRAARTTTLRLDWAAR